MGDGLNNAVVNSETRFYQVLAVACYSRGNYFYSIPRKGVNFLDFCGNNIQRSAHTGAVVLIQKLALRRDKYQFCGSRTCVNAEVSLTLVLVYIRIFQVELLVPFNKFIVLFFRGKKRLTCYNIVARLCVFNLYNNFIKVHRLARFLSMERAAVSHKAGSVFWENSVFLGKLQCVHKGFPKSLLERERTSQKQNFSLDSASLCKSRNSLVDYRLEDRSGNILTLCALIEQGLNVRLCENSAA